MSKKRQRNALSKLSELDLAVDFLCSRSCIHCLSHLATDMCYLFYNLSLIMNACFFDKILIPDFKRVAEPDKFQSHGWKSSPYNPHVLIGKHNVRKNKTDEESKIFARKKC